MRIKHHYKVLVIILLVTIITLLHYKSSSVGSQLHEFYRLLYFIPIIYSAFNYGFKGSIAVALFVSFIYSPHIVLSIGLNIKTLNEFLDILVFFAIGIITGTLVEKKNIAFTTLDNQLKKYIILENYTNGIIQSIKTGVIAVNNDMLITIVNNGAKEILNIEHECVGDNFADVLSCCENIKDRAEEVIKKNRAFENIEVDIKELDKVRSIRISLFPLNFETINKGLVIILEDITDVKKIQLQMQRNDKLAALGQLSTGIAHEIRNPLAIIKMIEQTMKGEIRDNPEFIKELDIIDEEIDRANKVVKALMEFGKPSKNEKNLTSLNLIIEDVLTIANKYITQHGVSVSLNKTELPYILLDKEQLKQAFINIIFNAIDAMHSGGKIYIETKQIDNKWIQISFKDTGEGIRKEDLEKIFNPFFTTKQQGTGLGLPLVHRIVDEHSGVINVRSDLGKGTTFEIRFPIKA